MNLLEELEKAKTQHRVLARKKDTHVRVMVEDRELLIKLSEKTGVSMTRLVGIALRLLAEETKLVETRLGLLAEDLNGITDNVRTD